MAFSYVGGNRSSGNSSSPSNTHGQTISAGDLVLAYVNSNSTTAISADAGGALFTEAVDEQPGTKTARQALYWKIAGASEPTSYSFTAGSAHWQCHVRVFSSAADAEVGTSPNTHIQAGTSNDLVCGAIAGEVIGDDELSVVFAGKDGRRTSAFEDYTVADNSFVSPFGNNQNQTTGSAHRIYTTGETFSGDLTIETADGSDAIIDNTYSVHMTFVESSGDTTVNAGVDALVLAEQAAVITSDVNISAGVDALSVATFQAGVATSVDIQASVDALTLATSQASIAVDVNVQAGTDDLVIATHQAALASDTNIAAGIDALVLTGHQASLSADAVIDASLSALVLTEQPASIANDVVVSTNLEALTLAELQASIGSSININAGFDALVLEESVATIVSGTISITDVDGDEQWGDGDNGLIITGTGFC